ncbi:Lipoyltransferase 1 mitochondrial [Fasciola hepatica]|uniref:Lipoyltransferase 1 mitochondrial n=1 Tax=Fasciola hepatica TaxID=6192 RepID=A0A4E0RXP2_FASHE|nr:Lipoyltransferase 1 mitochondrial [Fasciola hepatica]
MLWPRSLGRYSFLTTVSLVFRIPVRLCSRIFVLNSGDIYRNLAFEACLFGDSDRFECHPAGKLPPTDIILWRSAPCVVIGRFQNAWNEIRTDLLRKHGWRLARRESGGGAVFHDRGNLNICFMQSRQVLDRRKCMEALQRPLQSLLTNRAVHVGDRFDLWISATVSGSEDHNQSLRKKISGSSSKFGSKVAYHHCTLLCEANLENLSDVLRPSFRTLQTRASTSVRSPVVNLCLPVDQVQQKLIDHLSEWIGQMDGSLKKPTILQVPEYGECEYVARERFERKMDELTAWTWVYGSSPAFQLDVKKEATMESDDDQFIPSVRLHCDRGGRVNCLRVGDDESPKSELHRFVCDLSNTLTGLECRPFAWDMALDQFWAKYIFSNPETGWEVDKTRLIETLKILSTRF